MITRRVRKIVVALVIVIAVFSLALSRLYDVRLNLTPSVPKGLYIRASSKDATFISFCPSQEISSFANPRGYRPKGLLCEDGFQPLLKPIAARSGDVVSVTEKGIEVNGHLLPNTRQHKSDGHGRAMPLVAPGTYQVAPNSYWLLSTYNDASFDSRYFGPVTYTKGMAYEKSFWTF